MIVLDLPQATLSRNAVDKMHWAKRNRMRGDWQWMVKAAVLEGRIHVVCHPHVLMTIERISPRKLDPDNFSGGCKQLQDALKREGFFVDDDEKHLTTTYIQHVGNPARTIIRMTAASAAPRS